MWSEDQWQITENKINNSKKNNNKKIEYTCAGVVI